MQFGRRAARVGKDSGQPRGKVMRLYCELIDQPGRVFIADEILLVQREQSVSQKLRNASHAARGVVDIPSIFKVSAEQQTEFGVPETVLDNPAAQRPRVRRDGFFQAGDFALGVV